MNILRRLWFIWLYMRRPRWDSGLTPPELTEFLHNRPPGRVIDLGCGTGTNVLTLAARGWQATGVDFVPAAIRQARAKVRQSGLTVQFIQADVSRLPPGLASFDLVLDIGCFHGLEPAARSMYLDQLDQILRPDGIWFLYAFLSEKSTPGLASADLERILARFHLLSRQNGTDRGQQTSAYLILQKS